MNKVSRRASACSDNGYGFHFISSSDTCSSCCCCYCCCSCFCCWGIYVCLASVQGNCQRVAAAVKIGIKNREIGNKIGEWRRQQRQSHPNTEQALRLKQTKPNRSTFHVQLSAVLFPWLPLPSLFGCLSLLPGEQSYFACYIYRVQWMDISWLLTWCTVVWND